MSDDRPKKSWRELDRMRDSRSSRTPRRDPQDYGRKKTESSTSYRNYKSNLDKLFTPGGADLPESLKAKLGPISESDQNSRALKKDLYDKADAPSLSAYMDAGLELPDDARFLMRLIDLDDLALLQPVLQKILDIVEDGRRPNRMLLLQKLDALLMRCSDRGGTDEITELAQMLRSALD